ncbi:hypothetical protein [Paracidovorax wautersii]|uniref:Uncharacterized protein n=1 Tax=Paracidovorax wautersii TaxID=1177982 RepID=A0ABU1IG66_9BURK|nr:hypothetical protein [Paracidovorax wautersii]MDR6216213.1 hypothetical protein [Paracidovorax wautersii]
MILNQAQAEAVYSAMCALNNVSGRCTELAIGDGDAIVQNYTSGTVIVIDGNATERYADQTAFATAYSLQ